MNDQYNTAFGWVLFSGIVALGLSILSGMYFHGDEIEVPEKPGVIVEEASDGSAGGDSGPSLAELLATGDPSLGEAVFAKCSACHTIASGGANGIGPNLYGVLGSAVGGHSPGFSYSSALKDHGGSWTYENMDAWLKSPAAFAQGTKMSFAGLSKGEDRANLMLYMKEMGGGPPLPEFDPDAQAAEAETGEGEAGSVDETEMDTNVVGGSEAAMENANKATNAGADASPSE